MSISVKHGSDSYAYISHDGRHYWILSETSRPSFNKMIGMITDRVMAGKLYEIALCSGYTDRDFDKIRTNAPTKPIRATAGAKKASPRIVSERKIAPRKSTLTNSIKLF